MRQKAITLCDATWKLANEKENFSEWVRAQLLTSDENQKEERKAAEDFKKEHGRYPRWYVESYS